MMARLLLCIAILAASLTGYDPCDLCPPHGEPAPRHCDVCNR